MVVSPEIVYTYEDDAGKESTGAIKVAVGFNLADYIEAGQALAQFLDNLVHGRIKPIAEICFGVDLSSLGLGNTLIPTSDVEEVAHFQFITAENRTVHMNVPGLNESLVVPGSNALNQADPIVANFVTAMVDGYLLTVAGGTVSPCDIGESDIVGLIAAEEEFRNSGSRS